VGKELGKVLNKIEINLIALPQEIKQFKDDKLIGSATTSEGMKKVEEIVKHTEDPFDAIRLLRVINMFEPTKITFEEK